LSCRSPQRRPDRRAPFRSSTLPKHDLAFVQYVALRVVRHSRAVMPAYEVAIVEMPYVSLVYDVNGEHVDLLSDKGEVSTLAVFVKRVFSPGAGFAKKRY